jgi:homocitrate synthase NifV
MDRITLIDTTLRDGIQGPDIQISASQRLAITEMLYDIGINEFEIGTPAIGSDECNVIKKSVKRFHGCRMSAWCRANLDDIHRAASTGCDTVHISFPLSDIHLAALGKNEDWLYDTLETVAHVSRSLFDRFTIGCQDATRAPLYRLLTFINRSRSLGAYRIRIADTVGIMTPFGTSNLIKAILSKYANLSLEFHAHNDLGMATANAVTALMSGATAVSTTVNGIGERAGNAAFEETVMALTHTGLNPDPIIDTGKLNDICNKVAIFTGRPIAPSKPITGANVFTHQSGIHCHALNRDPHTYEPFDPTLAGHQPSRFVAGPGSGTAVIKTMLGDTGENMSPKQIKNFLSIIKDESHKKNRSLVSDEVKKLYKIKKDQIHELSL